MFFDEDIHDLLGWFPPRDLPTTSGLAHKKVLVRQRSGNGLVRANHITTHVELLIERSPGRISISQVAQKFNVAIETVHDLLYTHENTSWLDVTESTIIPRAERISMTEQLRGQIDNKLSPVTEFLVGNEISQRTFDRLVKEHNARIPPADPLHLTTWEAKRTGAVYFATLRYKDELEASIKKAMLDSATESLEIRPEQLPGHPTPLIIYDIAVDLSSSQNGRIEGQLELHNANGVIFRSRASMLRWRDAEIEGLRGLQGKSRATHLQQFVYKLPDLYPTVENAKQYIQQEVGEEVIFFADLAVRKETLDSVADEGATQLARVGYASIDFAISTSEEASRLIQEHLSLSLKERGLAIVGHHDYIYISEKLLSQIRDQISKHAKRQASKGLGELSFEEAWSLAIRSEDDGKDEGGLQIPDHIAEALRVLLYVDSSLRTAAESAFNDSIEEHQLETRASFARFWTEKILLKTQLYRQALEDVNDLKLQAELSEILQKHLSTELVSSVLARARKDCVLPNDKKTARNIAALEAATGAQSSVDIVYALETFRRKQDIAPLDAFQLTDGKLSQLQDLARSTQRDTDGPRLFLKLVIQFHARCSKGLLYATGKFAPKILRLIKDRLGREEYGKLDQLKEKVKAEKVGKQDIDAMRKMALDEVDAPTEASDGHEDSVS